MTTTENEENEHGQNEERTENVLSTKVIPEKIMDMMKYLSKNTSIVFKSQQRNEPELQETQKLKVALDVYQRNPQTFLIRFGGYLQEGHLKDFARYSIAEGDQEMILMVEDFLNKLKTRKRDVKNRRYTALQKLIKEGEYFSEQEMMKRQPELYEELIGQYLTHKEIQKRDSYDVKNTTFSGILMHNLEQEQLNDIMKKAQSGVQSEQDDDSTEKGISDALAKEDAEVPPNCRHQWGNFDNEHIACSSSKIKDEKSSISIQKTPVPVADLIMADERELLRQEFVSQMHQQFLSGQDKDFDYSTVDDNTQYDDLNLINQDKEDKYFEDSEDEEGNVGEHSVNKMSDAEESEDELETFMKHLNKHHSLQSCNNN